jgi:hypothetical protein
VSSGASCVSMPTRESRLLLRRPLLRPRQLDSLSSANEAFVERFAASFLLRTSRLPTISDRFLWTFLPTPQMTFCSRLLYHCFLSSLRILDACYPQCCFWLANLLRSDQQIVFSIVCEMQWTTAADVTTKKMRRY